MTKHTTEADSRPTEQQGHYDRNRALLRSILSGAMPVLAPSAQSTGVTLTLERFAINQRTQAPVPYEGAMGLERILAEMARVYQGGEIISDGRLVGVRGVLGIEGFDEPINLSATLRLGAQVALAVGPSPLFEQLMSAIRVFDRQFHLACRALGVDVELVAQGYNPHVTTPSDVVPVPLSRNVLANAYLSQTGRYARDALRCTATTTVRLAIPPDEAEAVRQFRLATALAPILDFLTDNTLSVRGSHPRRTPRMVGFSLWSQVDPARTGIAAGTFDEGFGFNAYLDWLEGIRPIYFVSDEGITFSTGTDTCGDLMRERELSAPEAAHLLSMAYPFVRWNGGLELPIADALPVRLAGSYCALVAGLFDTAAQRDALDKLLSTAELDEQAVVSAWNELAAKGWDARVYGRPVSLIANELGIIAPRGLSTLEDRRLTSGLTQLWDVRMVPRDTLVRNWESAHPMTREEEAIERYGEGAVMPYDQLSEDPPAGQTSPIPVVPQ